MDRRRFMASVGAMALARVSGWAAESHHIEKIGVQLYTVRDLLSKDFEGTLREVARIGYKEVEFAGYLADITKLTPPPKRVREILDSLGLSAPSSHVPYTALARETWPRVLEASAAVGHRYVVNPAIDRDLAKRADGWKQAAETFNRAGRESSGLGIQLAYHNHTEEFLPVQGKLPYDILLSECDGALVKMEMDLGWVHVAKADPLEYFARYPGRFPLVHVKDFDKDGTMTEVGRGIIDWKAIFSKSEQAGIKHYFVEHDQPKAPIESIRTSYAYLERLRF
ncbi:MAG: sugar phosphate isomerase/epimerase [Acidobacteria bacterium]|nr:sugar phosphate isomerase/epimerase [Acidobacteriota bacterium]